MFLQQIPGADDLQTDLSRTRECRSSTSETTPVYLQAAAFFEIRRALSADAPFKMGSPAKRRKLNDSSNSSPASSRNLDFFFGKQKQDETSRPADGERTTEDALEPTELTDEELARKLQAEWNKAASEEVLVAAAAAGHIGGKSSHETASGGIKGKGTSVDIDGGRDLKDKAFDGQTEPQPLHRKGKNTLSLQSTASEEDAITSSIPFDESPLTFEPSKYVSRLQSHWAAEGGDSSYALLTRCFVLINGTQSRIKIVDTLVNLLRVIIEGDPSSLLPAVRTSCYVCAIIETFSLVSAGCDSLLVLPAHQICCECHYVPSS